jgi:hypothetical protein
MAESARRWHFGDIVVLRDPLETRATRAYTAITGDTTPNIPGWPYMVIEDNQDAVALYLPEGTRLWRWDITEQRFREPRTTRGDSLRLLYPGKPFQVDLFFDSGSGPAPWVSYFFLREAAPGYEGTPSRIGHGRIPEPTAPPVIHEGHPSAQMPAGQKGRFYGWKVDLIAPFVRTSLGFDVCDEVLDLIVWPDGSHAWKDLDQMAELVRMGIYSEKEVNHLYEAGNEVLRLLQQGRPPFDHQWLDWTPPGHIPRPKAPDGWQWLPLADSEWGRLHRQQGRKRQQDSQSV